MKDRSAASSQLPPGQSWSGPRFAGGAGAEVWGWTWDGWVWDGGPSNQFGPQPGSMGGSGLRLAVGSGEWARNLNLGPGADLSGACLGRMGFWGNSELAQFERLYS